MNYEKQNGEEVMKTANQVIAKIVKVECPNCGKTLEGWTSDPRGTTDKCDYCEKEYLVAANAEVIIRG